MTVFDFWLLVIIGKIIFNRTENLLNLDFSCQFEVYLDKNLAVYDIPAIHSTFMKCLMLSLRGVN